MDCKSNGADAKLLSLLPRPYTGDRPNCEVRVQAGARPETGVRALYAPCPRTRQPYSRDGCRAPGGHAGQLLLAGEHPQRVPLGMQL